MVAPRRYGAWRRTRACRAPESVRADRSSRQPGATSQPPMPGWLSCPSGLGRERRVALVIALARRSGRDRLSRLPSRRRGFRQRFDSGLASSSSQENPAAPGGGAVSVLVRVAEPLGA